MRTVNPQTRHGSRDVVVVSPGRPGFEVPAEEAPLVQSGVVIITQNGASGSVQQFSVAFPQPFADTPVVTFSSGNSKYLVSVSGPSATGSGFWVRHVAGVAPPDTFSVYWIAVGEAY